MAEEQGRYVHRWLVFGAGWEEDHEGLAVVGTFEGRDTAARVATLLQEAIPATPRGDRVRYAVRELDEAGVEGRFLLYGVGAHDASVAAPLLAYPQQQGAVKALVAVVRAVVALTGHSGGERFRIADLTRPIPEPYAAVLLAAGVDV
jgi:hypothetical protein